MKLSKLIPGFIKSRIMRSQTYGIYRGTFAQQGEDLLYAQYLTAWTLLHRHT
ncbi:MAG: hypothetical protein IJS28_04550 [Synergistaceae bacterium]|nr:hypothetical protein [Synergistaceae bacterium]